MQFSLRTLLILVSVAAVVLAVWLGYRRATMAHLTWLSLSSPEAQSLFAQESVVPMPDHGYGFVYRARRCRIKTPQISEPFSGSFKFDRQTLIVDIDHELAAGELLKQVRDADVLLPGRFVIRGRVVDRRGRPLSNAIVDLMGPFVFINHFQTRDDGTFTMPLEDGGMSPPAGSRYYLRVRAAEETAEKHVRWNTPTFTLDADQGERVAVIVIPR